jgi:carboxyl-terminal processing protease
MSGRTRTLVFLVSTPLVVIVAVGGLLGAVSPAAQQAMPHLAVFNDVVRLIQSAYVEPPNMSHVMDGAMRGLVDGLDPDTSYLTPDDVRTVETQSALPDGDVGLVIARQSYLRIVGVRDGSPAQRAGLQSGDFIRAIDDTPTRDMSSVTGARLLRGAPGSKVTLLIIRNGDVADPRPVEVVREAPKTDRASGKRLPGGEAYVRVASFGPGAAAAIKSSIVETGAAANAGVVVDLRDVADGANEEGIAAARLFVKSGTLAIRAGRPARSAGQPQAAASDAADAAGQDDSASNAAPARGRAQRPIPIPANAVRTDAAAGDGVLTMPVVLLVSNGTAHAAEIFASALLGNQRARLVGEPTAGLAGVQRLVRLPDGYALLMTTERYLQNDGNPIQGRGLRPTVFVEGPRVGFEETPPATDPILERGIRELKSPTPAAAKTADETASETTRPAARPNPTPLPPPDAPIPPREVDPSTLPKRPPVDPSTLPKPPAQPDRR